ncbi:unnamed protein product [marine sediment metagenome]|uniref:Uncharacterized protein n=1 Tax=marine sediment metagenome TaxID=412755 RepID=X1IGM0_9ZZZZ
MSFAGTTISVDEKRVEATTWLFAHLYGGSVGKAIAGANDKVVKAILGIEFSTSDFGACATISLP